MGQMVKNLPAMQETQVPSLCWDDPIEEGMATHSGILGWIISWTEESGRLQSMRVQNRYGGLYNCLQGNQFSSVQSLSRVRLFATP